MRIFYAAGSQPHGSLTQSRVWHYNLYLPLCDLGHTVIPLRYDLEPHYANANDTVLSQQQFNQLHGPGLEAELLRQIDEVHRQQPIDLFFSYFYSSFARPETIEAIRRRGIVTVNWYCNASYQFHLVEKIAPAYDFCLVPEKFRLDDYHRIGAHPIYCQEAANPNFYQPYPLRQEFDVSFVGAQYADRADYVRGLLDQGIDVRVWGPGWRSLCPPESIARRAWWEGRRLKRKLLGQRYQDVVLPPTVCGEPLTDDEMVRLYSRSKISLGFSNVGETHSTGQPIKQIRLRDFEATMCGAFYMVEYMDELEEFYEIGTEIVCYRDEEDMVQQVMYFLSHDAEREAIRQAGHKRAINEHTWQRRLQNAFNQMGLGA
jgi:spore maturation protein CgeB